MDDRLFGKLKVSVPLSAAECRVLEGLLSPARPVARHTVLVSEDEPVSHGIVMLEGWAMRLRTLPDGRRQILRFAIPGDLCDPLFFVPRRAIHAIETLTEGRIATLPAEPLLGLFARQPRIAAAFWWLAGHEQAVLQERLVEIGRRSAYERTAYTIWELWQRMRFAGQAAGGSFAFPLTQEQFADALSLTVVHMNRMLRTLREAGCIELRSRTITILDPAGLEAIAKGERERLVLDGLSPALRRQLA